MTCAFRFCLKKGGRCQICIHSGSEMDYGAWHSWDLSWCFEYLHELYPRGAPEISSYDNLLPLPRTAVLLRADCLSLAYIKAFTYYDVCSKVGMQNGLWITYFKKCPLETPPLNLICLCFIIINLLLCIEKWQHLASIYHIWLFSD